MTLTLFQGTDSGATIRLEAEADGRLELAVKAGGGTTVVAELERPELLELLENITAIAAAVGLVDRHRRRLVDQAARMAAGDSDPLQLSEAEELEREANKRAAVRELLDSRTRRRPAGAGPTVDELNEETRRYKEAAEERARLDAEEAARRRRLELEPPLPGLELEELRRPSVEEVGA